MIRLPFSSKNAVAISALVSALVLVTGFAQPAEAQAAVKKTSAKKSSKKAAAGATAAAAATAAALTPADADQLAAADKVYYGANACEFNQKVDLSQSKTNPGYVDLHYGKKTYVMKPVSSSTGAVVLEDTKKEMKLVQIPSKSMLFNQKTGQRLADSCVNPTRHASAK